MRWYSSKFAVRAISEILCGPKKCADAAFLRKTAIGCINSIYTNSEFAPPATGIYRIRRGQISAP
jgi:hypothetical protein